MASGIFRPLVAMLLVLCCSVVKAATVEGLYIAELLVPEQQAQPTQSQLRQGLTQVLIKVSGVAEIVSKPAVATALQGPQQFMQQFSYQSTQTPVATGDGREVLGQRLIIEFAPDQVDDLLLSANAVAVGFARPEVLVWMVAEQGSGPRDLLAPEGPVYRQLNGLARQRALPVVAPLMDLADQQALSVSDLWGFFEAPIQQASERYQPEAILVGRLIQSDNGGWQSQWRLLTGAGSRSIQPTGTLNEQLRQAVNETADQLLAGLANPGFRYQESGVRLAVTNIDSIADYAQLITYLRELPPIESARVSEVHADQVTLRIELQGGDTALEQAVRLNPRMTATSRLQTAAEDAGLVYRWQE